MKTTPRTLAMFARRQAAWIMFAAATFGAHAADLHLVGNFGYTTQNNNATAIITADRIENRTNGGNSGTIRLELWATSTRYTGTGGISGYRLATHSLGQLGGGRVYTGISSGTVALTMPPAGTWFVSLLVTEFTGGSGDGFVIRDSGSFPNTLVVGGGGAGGGGGGGGNGASTLELVGNVSYEPQNNNTGVVIRVDRVSNTTSGGRSGTLRLELWASANAYAGGSISGYRLAEHRLDPLAGGSSYTNISSGTISFTPPPNGTWRVTLLLTEFSSSVSANDGYSVRDWSSFANPLVMGSGGGGGSTPPPITDDHGNTRASATAVGLNTTTAGRINSAGDLDYFRITTTVNGTLAVSTAGGTDTTGELQDGNGLVLASNDDGSDTNFSLSRIVNAGTYYIAVRAYSDGTGDYALRVSFTAASAPPPPPATTPPPPGTPPPATPPPAAGGGRLVNLSVRSVAGSGDQTLIVACVVGGTGNKALLVRGVGPTLASFNVGGVLNDPNLQIYAGSALRLSNDNWGQASNVGAMPSLFARLGAFALPNASRDAAVLDNFAPGAWSMQVSGPAGGVALVEVYDADATPSTAAARLVNLSARTEVGTGERALFAGFAVSGGPRKLLIRGVGPSLRSFNVSGVLSDPVLRLYTGATLIAENDDAAGSDDLMQIELAARAVGAFPLGSALDSALLVTLAPGVYSAEVTGLDGGTGIGLVEIYEVP